MAPVRRLVLDILKPYEPPMLELAQNVADTGGVAGVNATLIEMDKEVQNVKLTVEGEGIDYDSVEEHIRDLGATVHSVDEIVCGEYMVEDKRTFQD